MEYDRTFRFAAARFNSLFAYQLIWDLQSFGGTVSEMVPRDKLMRLLSDVHGHNFRVRILVTNHSAELESDCVVSDIELERIVMAWRNKNLSVHDDFIAHQYRATTERMADVLMRKLRTKLGHTHIKRVEVWENDDIVAVAT